MAKVQYSGIGITEMAGKIGGNVLARNASGSYSRKNTAPVQPNSPAQAAVKGIFASIANAWRDLTEAQRNGWEQAAPDFPQTNSLGQVFFLTGQQLYNKFNNSLQQLGLAGIDDAPAPGTIYSPASAVVNAVGTGGGTPAELDVDIPEAVPAGQEVAIFVTPPLSAGINNFNNRLELLRTEAAGNGPSFDILADYEAKYGTFVAGQKIGVAVVAVNTATGQRGVEVSGSAVAS